MYPEIEFDVPVGTGQMGTLGDCWDRTWVRAQECKESVRIITQCLTQLKGDHKRTKEFNPRAAVPKKIRPKAQDLYVRAENPKGETGFSSGLTEGQIFLSDVVQEAQALPTCLLSMTYQKEA